MPTDEPRSPRSYVVTPMWARTQEESRRQTRLEFWRAGTEAGRTRPPGESGPLFSLIRVEIRRRRLAAPRLLRRDYTEALTDCHRASTLVPTEPITAIAATTIRPAIR